MIADDTICPYCKRYVEICHEDGYGCEEDETYFQECEYCGNTFAYTTLIEYKYKVKKAPCKNGGDHNLKKIIGFPKEFFLYRRRCVYCDETIVVDKEKHEKSLREYSDKLGDSVYRKLLKQNLIVV